MTFKSRARVCLIGMDILCTGISETKLPLSGGFEEELDLFSQSTLWFFPPGPGFRESHVPRKMELANQKSLVTPAVVPKDKDCRVSCPVFSSFCSRGEVHEMIWLAHLEDGTVARQIIKPLKVMPG